MPYVTKLIGKNERIVGIARLHWIYLAKGLFGFAVCVLGGVFIDAVIFHALSSLSDMAPNAGDKMAVVAGTWITPMFTIFGGFYFLFFLLKVLYTEIALTELRLMHKSGFIFVKVQEIDIEEISGENVDMGYFGTLLGYGYILLDCRFIGDVALPAIGQPNKFMKALHNIRMNLTSVQPEAHNIAKAIMNEIPKAASDENLQNEMLKPQEPKPVELSQPDQNENADAVTKTEEAEEAEEAVEPTTTPVVDHEHEKEILQLQIAKLELEVKLKEVEVEAANTENEEEAPQNDIKNPVVATAPVTRTTTPPTDAPNSVPANPALNVAAAVQGTVPEMAKMPQVTDKVAEELIASGLIPHPDEIKPEEPFVEKPATPKAPTDEERLEPTKADPLQHSFGSAAFVFESIEDGNPKPEPAI